MGVAAVVAAALGLAYYLNTQAPAKAPAGPVVTVKTAPVSIGELRSTVRVTGVISAENFAALMVPQVRGSRSDRGRSFNSSSGSTTSPTITVQSNANKSNADPGRTRGTLGGSSGGGSSSGSADASSSGSSSGGGGSGRSRSGFATTYSVRGGGSGGSGRSSGGGDDSGGSSMGGSSMGGSGRRSMGGGGDFAMVLVGLANPGSTVKKGDIVAEFDRQYQELRRDDYRDALSQMEANIQKMKADLAVTKEIHEHQIRQAKAAWQKAEMDLKTIEVRSAIETEKFRLAVEEAKAEYEQLVAESKLLGESQRAQIRGAEIDRDQARIELQRAENNVEKLIMKAPMDGIVVMQSIFRGGDFGQIKQGDQVYSGQRFMTIVDPRSMVLNATVNQVDAEKLRLGVKARIKFDAYNDIETTATLIGIGAMAKTSVFRASYVADIPIRLKLDQVEPRIIPDLTASAEILINAEKEAVIAPRAGIFEDNGSSFAFVRSPEGWVRRDVEVGLENHVAVAIRKGLREGDIIALQRPI